MRVKNLFELTGRERDDEHRRVIEERLIELAHSSSISVTELINQPPNVAETVGNILLGQAYRDNKMETGIRVPRELVNYRIKLRPINGHSTIRWKTGKTEGPPIYRGAFSVTQMVDTYDEVQPDASGVAELSLPEAWVAMRQAGKNCRPVRRTDMQSRMWRFEEVTDQPVGESRRKRGGDAHAV